MNINKILFGFIKIAFTFLVIIFVLYVGVRLCGIGYDYGYRVFTEPAITTENGEDVLVQIKDGMSDKEVGQMLYDKGLVRDAKLFTIQLKLSVYSGKLKTGVYTLNTSMTAKDMMIVMSESEDSTEDTETVAPVEDTKEN